MASKRKRLPYGVSDFKKVRLNDYYYVDKTGFITSLEDYEYVLFLRPRRFGKSLFANMLKAYYDINYADKFDALFGELEIGKEPTPSHNTYLVLSFNFSGVDSKPENVQESFNRSALMSIEIFLSAYKDKLGENAHEKVIEGTQNCAEALSALSIITSEAGYKMYIVIDEYDNFANTLMSVNEDSYHDILHADGFVRYFYNVLKESTTNNNAAIDRIFITGVSPLCLSDVTSGFNIARNLSTVPTFNNMVGFTVSEVMDMLTYFTGSEETAKSLMPTARSYYDNYCFSKLAARRSEHVFNSDMVLYFIDNYVANEEVTAENLLDSNAKSDYVKLQSLARQGGSPEEKNAMLQSILNNGYTTTDLKSEFQIRELAETQNFVSMLFYLGLLTYGYSPDGQPALVVANDAMRQQYGTYLSTSYAKMMNWRTDQLMMSKLWMNWGVKGQWQPLISYIASVMQENDSVRDFTPQAESFVKGFMLAHLCKGNGYVVRTEAEMDHGYSDIYLYPIVPEYRNALVLELKYLNPTATDAEVDSVRQAAHKQVANYVADKRLQAEAEAKGWGLAAAVAVFRGWKVESVEGLNLLTVHS